MTWSRAALWAALFLFLAAFGSGLLNDVNSSDQQAVQPGARLSGTVVQVTDGDTIVVKLGARKENVRYIGVDTPETVKPNSPVECFGPEASAFNKRFAAQAQVTLELDREVRDRYGRLLAYVYVGSRMVNAELIARGYARTLSIEPNSSHASDFSRLAAAARSSRRGLWAACN